MTRAAWLLLPVLAACTPELPGDYYEISLELTDDQCNDPPVPSSETWTYRVVTTGNDVGIFIDEGRLATGSFLGCNLTYRSPLLSERREDGTAVRWSIEGTAQVSAGEGCEAGDGWLGSERIAIVSSSDEQAVPTGCTYTMSAEGSYLKTVE